jgi:hypothetical protein
MSTSSEGTPQSNQSVHQAFSAQQRATRTLPACIRVFPFPGASQEKGGNANLGGCPRRGLPTNGDYSLRTWRWRDARRRLARAAQSGAGRPARTTRRHGHDQSGAGGAVPPRSAVGTRPAGTTGAAIPRRGAAGPVLPWPVIRSGTAGAPRTAGAAVLPRPVARSGAAGSARFEHHAVVVMVAVVMPENEGADEEHRRNDEHDPREDHHPSGRDVEPRRLHGGHRLQRRRWWRRRGCRGWGWLSGRLGLRFGCLAHALHTAPRTLSLTGWADKIAVNRDAAVRRRLSQKPGSPALDVSAGLLVVKWVSRGPNPPAR